MSCLIRVHLQIHTFIYFRFDFDFGFSGVILISSYSGSIISNLTVFRLDLPFYDLEGLLKDGTYSLGMLQTTFVFEIFKVSVICKIISLSNIILLFSLYSSKKAF